MALDKLAIFAADWTSFLQRHFPHTRSVVLYTFGILLIVLMFVNLMVYITRIGSSSLFFYDNFAKDPDVEIYPFRDLSNGTTSACLQVVYNTTRYLLLINFLNGLYFCLFWHRWHHVYLRSALAASLGTLPVVLNAISLSAFGSVVISPSDLQNSLPRYPELSYIELEDWFASWKADYRAHRVFQLAMTSAVALVQAVSIAFWVWLMPSHWRLPNNYEPTISSHQKRRRVQNASSETELQRLLITTNDEGSLEGVFKEHEREFLAQASPFSM